MENTDNFAVSFNSDTSDEESDSNGQQQVDAFSNTVTDTPHSVTNTPTSVTDKPQSFVNGEITQTVETTVSTESEQEPGVVDGMSTVVSSLFDDLCDSVGKIKEKDISVCPLEKIGDSGKNVCGDCFSFTLESRCSEVQSFAPPQPEASSGECEESAVRGQEIVCSDVSSGESLVGKHTQAAAVRQSTSEVHSNMEEGTLASLSGEGSASVPTLSGEGKYHLKEEGSTTLGTRVTATEPHHQHNRHIDISGTDSYRSKAESKCFTPEHDGEHYSRRSLDNVNESRFGNLENVQDYEFEERSGVSRKTGGVRELYEEDGCRSFEKTTTYVAGDRLSTDELIKRILAESRGEVASPAHQQIREQRMESPSTGRETGEQRIDSMDSEESRHWEERSNGRSHDHRDYLREARMPTSEPEYNPRYVQEEYTENPVRRTHTVDPYDDLYDRDSQGSSSRYQPRHFRSHVMRKQQAILQHDDWSEDEDQAYKREQQVEYIPDEEFIPQKAQDTDRVVQEKTEAIRDVVDKQSSVLQQLKSASDSFEEMSAEIKEIKQHFLDSQIRRSMIMDDIEHERMMMDQSEYEKTTRQQPYQSQRANRYFLQDPEDEDYDYKPSAARGARQKLVTLDKELEADTLGRGGLTGLAVGSSPLDTFRSKLSEKYQTALSGSALTSNYGTDKCNKYQSLYEDDATRRPRSKYTLTRSYGALDDSEDCQSQESSYRSPNLPSYRKYDLDKKDYNSTDYFTESKPRKPLYSTDYSTESKSLYSAGRSPSSTYSSLSRSKTLDYSSAPSTRSWQAPADSGFSSRFLDKVREKKACGEPVARDKPFTSRFLGKSFDTGSSFQRPTFNKMEDTSKLNGNGEVASTGEQS